MPGADGKRAPEDLYELLPAAEGVPAGLPFVAGLTGFADAGGAVAQLTDYFASTSSPEPLAVFDNDELLDYRARRPIIEFDEDHLTSYTPASLVLSLAKDEIGRPFLLLTGYEPDFQWDRFTSAVLGLLDRFAASTTTWVQSVPMPVPHTRPLQVTVGGNRRELVESMSVWKPTTRVPANVLHLLEFRLAEQDREVAEFVLLDDLTGDVLIAILERAGSGVIRREVVRRLVRKSVFARAIRSRLRQKPFSQHDRLATRNLRRQFEDPSVVRERSCRMQCDVQARPVVVVTRKDFAPGQVARLLRTPRVMSRRRKDVSRRGVVEVVSGGPRGAALTPRGSPDKRASAATELG